MKTDDAASVYIRPLDDWVMPEVLRIHRAGLPYSLNSRLGMDHLAYLYQAIAKDDRCYAGVAMLAGRPIGIISGTVNADALRARLLRSLPVRRALKIALGFLVHPSLVYSWWEETQISAPIAFDGRVASAILTAIAVDANMRGQGIGRLLVAALEQYLLRQGVTLYRLDTLIRNTTAREFYKRLSFCEVAVRANSVVLVKELVV